MDVTLCVLLWAREGRQDALGEYEDRVLALLADHGGQVIQRARTTGGSGGSGGSGGQPAEVQLLQFPSETAMDGFMDDPRRTALADEREAAVERTEVYRVLLLHSAGAPADGLAKGLGWPG